MWTPALITLLFLYFFLSFCLSGHVQPPQALLQADLGATTSFQIIEDLRQTAKAEDRGLEPDDIKSVLRATLIQVRDYGRSDGGALLDSPAF